jgi:hypothetical protein
VPGCSSLEPRHYSCQCRQRACPRPIMLPRTPMRSHLPHHPPPLSRQVPVTGRTPKWPRPWPPPPTSTACTPAATLWPWTPTRTAWRQAPTCRALSTTRCLAWDERGVCSQEWAGPCRALGGGWPDFALGRPGLLCCQWIGYGCSRSDSGMHPMVVRGTYWQLSLATIRYCQVATIRYCQ